MITEWASQGKVTVLLVARMEDAQPYLKKVQKDLPGSKRLQDTIKVDDKPVVKAIVDKNINSIRGMEVNRYLVLSHSEYTEKAVKELMIRIKQ
jgi:hypothetical protein